MSRPQLIKERIRLGELRPGDQLSPERELAELAGISRMTARQAIGYLVREGVLLVKHGTGTFVAEPKLIYDALHLSGFTEEMRRRGATAASRVLELTVVTPASHVALALQLPQGQPVVEIVRLRLFEATPMLLEMSFLPAALCPGLADEDLEAQSLYTVLEQKYGLLIRRARQMFEAAVPDAAERRLLQIDAGVGLIFVEGVTYSDRDQPLEYFQSKYRGDRFKFEWESRREATAGESEPSRLKLVFA